MLKEKLEFLRGPGGFRAAIYFALKLLVRVEAFRIVWILAQPSAFLKLPSGWRYLSFYTEEKLSNFRSDIIEQVAGQCGSKPEQLLKRGGSLHLLLIGDSLAAQLTIERGPVCRIDSPPLHLGMGETDTFLKYLYTWPAFRRQGAAKRLIAAAVGDLSTHNVQRIIAHVRATNVPSVAAFEHAGWNNRAMVVCTLGGRLLIAPGTARIGLSFRSAP
ncbi:GNAT family N-acetyltransferase [Nitrosovibrio tenuis]|uniref:Acetyltransferase (GNAT) family protein n=1 Tax=Nitrosovibrio tenuis TaxID=1233 RepID=A0A1H7FY07_9PROT|nr:GNAT family N-acetyltransferase [Nitrosovibrio tenuis]SEK30781.1 Acetyltransferase (GNAT) family protein [Nitrosovibrio tenuis]